VNAVFRLLARRAAGLETVVVSPLNAVQIAEVVA